jgi:RHS repeat-associated protein
VTRSRSLVYKGGLRDTAASTRGPGWPSQSEEPDNDDASTEFATVDHGMGAVLALSGSGCPDSRDDAELSSTRAAAAALTPAEGTDIAGDQGGVVTYTYDGAGRRVLKEYTPASDGVRAVYSVGKHLDVVERADGSLVMERYVLIDGQRAVYIPDSADGEIFHLHRDALGSTRWITDSHGRLVRRLRYEPFGRSIDEPPLRYRHAGEEVSERLTHLGGIRQYNNAIGRMMQPDSLIPDPANPQSLNRYAYVYNDPLAYTDPSGHWALPWELLDLVSYKLSADAWVASISQVADNPTSGTAWVQLSTDTVGVFADAAALALPVMPATCGLSRQAVRAATSVATEASRVDHAVDVVDAGGGAARRAAGGAGGAPGVPRPCFVAGTEVWTDEGLVPIEAVEAGQLVACAETESGEWSYCEVEERLEHHHDGELVTITADGESVESTGNHPFWVVSGHGLEFRPVAADADAGGDALDGSEDGRWVEALDVEPGDRVLLADGRQIGVESVTFSSGSLPVFNLRVAKHQTYAVGEAGVLVHNKANVYKPANVLQSGGNTIKKSTAKALGLEPRVARDAMHKMKPDILAEARDTGKIMSNGDYVHKETGEVLGNIFDYVP